MTEVLLLLGSQRTAHEAVAESVRTMREGGAEVSLASRVVPSEALRDACDRVAVIGPGLTAGAILNEQVAAAAAQAAAAPPPEPPSGAARVRAAVEWRARRVRRGVARRTAKARGAFVEPTKCWSDVRHSAEAMAWAASADVVCAVDAPMVRAAWLLGRRRAEPEILYGLAAAEGAVARGNVS